jgi:hypothetical protein
MRPALIAQTVVFHESDRPAAKKLATNLYTRLTRPISDRLGFGAGIPVWSAVDASSVDLNAADRIVLVPVLGATTRAACGQDVVRTISEWVSGCPAAHIVILSNSEDWSREEFPGNVEYYNRATEQVILDRIIVAVARSLGLADGQAMLFVSHSGDDPGADDQAQGILAHARKDPTSRKFFGRIVDSIDAENDQTVSESLKSNAIFVVVRTDNYAAKVRCAEELHHAKVNRIPTLTVEVLQTGEPRSDPYGGNGPSIVASGDHGAVITRAMIEWVRDRFFQYEAARMARQAELPAPIVISRPPELFDLAQKDFSGPGARFVMYPDPELPASEMEILLAIRPRVYLTTPLTAYRHFRHGPGGPAAPLDGIRIAISVSDSPDVDGKWGFTAEHVRDAITHLARSVISAGAVIAYGGDLRPDGYTRLFAQLILAYNRTTIGNKSRLRNYRPADTVPEGGPVEPYHLGLHPALKQRTILPPPPSKLPSALYMSEMRRLVAEDCNATFLLGGKVIPRGEDEQSRDGYSGPFPGVVEEAWRTLQAGKPLYVAAGFQGAAEIVAALMQDEPLPAELTTTRWSTNREYQDLIKKLANLGWGYKLGLPESMEELGLAIRKKAREFLANDGASTAWNGLTVEENRELFRSRDPMRITALTLKGLLRIREIRGQGKLAVELVHGDLTLAPRASAICVAIYKDAPVVGAGAALDELLGGVVTLAQTSPNDIDMVEINNSGIDADWLLVAKLGNLQTEEHIDDRIQSASRNVVRLTERYGFTDLATVIFGGSFSEDVTRNCDMMMEQFIKLAGRVRVSLFEVEDGRFAALQKQLTARQDLDVTTHRPGLKREPPRGNAATFLSVSWVRDELITTVLPPPASGVVFSHRSRFTQSDLGELNAGVGDRQTPPSLEVERRRPLLAEKLLGPEHGKWLEALSSTRVVIRHELISAPIPFEILIAPNKGAVGLNGGITRVLALPEIDPKLLSARPPKSGKIALLLVIDPTGDLEWARKEGQLVYDSVRDGEGIELKVIKNSDATKEAVREALKFADIFHYCGHAGFDGAFESGIDLADGRLTAKDLKGMEAVPRLAFVNGCEAGRVRGSKQEEEASQAFAELLLRMGIEAYLGTFWKVGDAGAATFAGIVYKILAQGETIGNAVLQGRRALYAAGNPDWVNYVLYGNSEFRISTGNPQDVVDLWNPSGLCGR